MLLERLGKKGLLEGKEFIDVANFQRIAFRLRRDCIAASARNSGPLDDIVAAEDSSLMENPDDGTAPQQLEGTDLWELLHRLEPLTSIATEIFNTLDEDGRPRDSASAELHEVRLQLRQTKEEIRDRLQRIIQQKGEALQDRTPTLRYDRQVLPVKAALKSRIPGIAHDYSTSGSTVFIEPREIIELNAELRRLYRKENILERQIWNQLSKRLHPVGTRLQSTFEALIEIDMAIARARYAQAIGASPARFTENNDIPLHIRNVCHPLLLWRSIHTSEKAIPIDFQVRGTCRAAILTGANAGGKTLAVKTLGLVALMAKCGLPIPRRLSEHDSTNSAVLDEVVTIPYFDRVLADIGDEQSLQQNLSTFSGHVQRIREILLHATTDSLILLDELGAGTDPAEGAALGIALVRFLVEQRQARFVFVTTHHSELKTLFFQDPALYENVSVEFDRDRLEPTYRLLWGVSGRSYALLVARKMGLHPEILDEAETLLQRSAGHPDPADLQRSVSNLAPASPNSSRLMDQIEEIRMEQLRILENARIEANEVDRLRLEYEERLGNVDQERQRMIEEQRSAIEAELAAVRAELKEMSERLRQNDLDQSEANQLTSDLESKVAGATSRLAIRSRGAHERRQVNKIELGDLVLVPSLGQAPLRVTQKLPDGRVRVALGNMSATISIDEITSVRQATETNNKTAPGSHKRRPLAPTATMNSPVARPVQVRTETNTIDLRGMRAHEVESAIEAAIDRGLQIGSLWIIHGHGTGRLRKTVREYLQSHPSVASFHDAPASEGGAGATIAILQ
jgi:DNA mismatch repair protein MutS2